MKPAESDIPSPERKQTQPDWWRGGLIYQIYPRSFADTNGDGIGDLAGIAAHMDYVAALGVDAIWLSPFYVSPMKDFGYDVADHCAIDPIFGTMDDFDALVAEAHERGIRLVIDLVISHTSDRHPWFEESRASRNNERADWYVWADPKRDGTPPNNWLSIFGGTAWTWDTRRCQYYLHNFLPSQPDLNFHNPQVQEALLDIVRFWLDRGVDGFRLDTANFYFHDPELRDNPALGPGGQTAGNQVTNPYSYQDHVYDKSRPENLAFLERMRGLLDRYPGIMTIGEIGADRDPAGTTAAYTEAGKRIHMAYSFDLMHEAFSALHVRTVVESFEAGIGSGWPSWALSNHDVMRVISRWHLEEEAERAAPLLNAMVLSLRGTPCLYQGDELGLEEAEVPYELLQDPYGREFWPSYKGRDGCRTPMPWVQDAPHAGFSWGTPWLPIPHAHAARAANLQEPDPASILNRTRRFIAWRKHHPCLLWGSIRFLDATEPVLCFVRQAAEETLLVVLNLGPEDAAWELPEGCRPARLEGHGFKGKLKDREVHLEGFDAFFGLL